MTLDLQQRLATPPKLGERYDAWATELDEARQSDPARWSDTLEPLVANRAWPNPLRVRGLPALSAWGRVLPTHPVTVTIRPTRGETTQELLACGSLERVKAIEFDSAAPSDLARLADAPWPTLEQLTFTQVAFDEAQLTALGAASLPSLATVWMQGGSAPTAALDQFLVGHRPKLRWLALVQVNLNPQLEAWDAPWPRLETLDLSGNDLGDAGARQLASASMPALVSLSLSRISLTSQGCSALIDSGTLANLERFSAQAAQLGADDIRRLATVAAKLEALDLSSCSLRDPGVIAIAQAHWPLIELRLANCGGLSAKATQALASASFASNLQELDLSDHEFLEHELRPLLDGPLCTSIKSRLAADMEMHAGYRPEY